MTVTVKRLCCVLEIDMESKKISFGFSKSSKKPNIINKTPANEKKVELIECLEEQTIKIKDAVEEVKGPLIIPLTGPANNIIHRIAESRITKKDTEPDVDNRLDSELTLDELAARELLKEAQNTEASKSASKILTLPAVKDELIIEGKEESTLEDYESVPITDYGMAMLRGMGWNEGMPIGKNTKAIVATKEPPLRPKGMGLGANKMANVKKQEKKIDNASELILKKGAFAKITAGSHKGLYCQVEGFDDEAGRVIVKTAMKDLTLSLNEFLLEVVTKDDYAKSSKVINNAKFEEYKQKTSRITERETDANTRLTKNKDESDFSDVEEEIDREKYKSRKHKEESSSHKQHKKKSAKKNKRRNRSRSSSLSHDRNDSRRQRSRSRDRSSERRGRRDDRKHKEKSSSRR